MASWKYSKYLHEIKDYENFDFRSPINVWDNKSIFSDEIDQIQFIEFDIHAGGVIFIPPYWWYSIKFLEEDTTIFEYNYYSIVNRIAFIGDTCKYYLQQQNIIRNFTKVISHVESDVSNKICGNEDTSKPHEIEINETKNHENIIDNNGISSLPTGL